jgi:predicted acylesterase/phospholipase RssA
MQHKYDEKSVPKADCMQSVSNSLSVAVSQISPLALTEGLEFQHPGVASTLRTVNPAHRIPPRRLALCGGGMRCIAHIGVFKALEQEGMLQHIRHIVGVSAGALFGLCYVLGYSLTDLERLACSLDFTVLQNIQPESLFQFPFTYGLDPGEGLEKLITSLLLRKGFSADCTFADLAAKRSISFTCYATDIKTAKMVTFSTNATPTFSILFALRATMSLPILYTPVKDPLTGHLLMDGGVLHNLPLVFQHEHERYETLAILFTKNKSFDDTKTDNNDMQLMDIIQSVYDCLVIMRNKPFLHKYSDQICCIDIEGFQVFDFAKGADVRKGLIDLAEKETKAFLRRPVASAKPVRRFSCA